MGRDGFFFQSAGSVIVSDLTLARQADSTGYYVLSDVDGPSSLTVSGNTIVGKVGTGTFTQDGGIHTTSGLYLGGDITPYTMGVGTYNLSGGELNTTWTDVGRNNIGVFNQGGGIHNAYSLTLGSCGGCGGVNSSGTYNLYGGYLNTNGTTVSAYGEGIFNQDGGTHNVTSDLLVGTGPAVVGAPERKGTYNLSGGDLNIGNNTIIGAGNSGFPGEPGALGHFYHTGGNHNITGSLIIGQYGSEGSGTGVYELSELDTGEGFTESNLNTNTTVVGEGGSGLFNHYRGTHTIVNDLNVGQNAGSTGTYNLYGGDLSAAIEVIGNQGTGTFKQTGGNNTVVYDLNLGQTATGDGSYELNGTGTLSTGRNLNVGVEGKGLFKQDGGSISVTEGLILGMMSGSNGHYELISGDVKSGWVHVGSSGEGIFDQSGGTNTTDSLVIGVIPGSSGTYNMEGGTLNAGNIYNKGDFNFTGGDIFANMDNYGTFSGKSTFTGNVSNYGTVNPGSSPGQLNIVGDYYQDLLGLLDIELAGLIQGDEYDFLNITGSAGLAGTLKVDLYGGFDPEYGNTFTILHADNGINGDFNKYVLPTLTVGLGWDVQVGPNDIKLAVVPEPVSTVLFIAGGAVFGARRLFRRKR